MTVSPPGRERERACPGVKRYSPGSGALRVVRGRAAACRSRPRRAGRGWPRRRPGRARCPASWAGRPGIARRARRVVGLDARDTRVDARLREGSGRAGASSVTSTSRAAAATAASGEAPRFARGVERVRTRAPVDGIQGVVDGHVRHGVDARFVERVVAGRDAGRDRGLARIRVPGDDRIGGGRPVGVGRGGDRRESRRRDGSRRGARVSASASSRHPHAIARHEREGAKGRARSPRRRRRRRPRRSPSRSPRRWCARPARRVVPTRWRRGGSGVEGLGDRRGRGERPGGEARHNQAGKSVRVVSGHAAQAARRAGRRPVEAGLLRSPTGSRVGSPCPDPAPQRGSPPPRAGRGAPRRPPRRTRRPEAARGAGDARAAARPHGLDRSPRGRPLGGASACQRAEDGAALRVAPAPAARRQRRGDRHPRARLRVAADPTATSTRRGSSACSTTGAPGRRSRCGAARHWPTWPTSRSLQPRSGGSMDCGCTRANWRSTRTSKPAGTAR